jgi:hypothetical protein
MQSNLPVTPKQRNVLRAMELGFEFTNAGISSMQERSLKALERKGLVVSPPDNDTSRSPWTLHPTYTI